ncbi:metallophosphoesterase [Flavobacteriaceae bacterium S356]|uniref:Metallophosphoesterase n=1 Tax=Asprobacillus argus TaxID=3076534 RepID=A0ABU3LE70_9FLAO|nr:metallophosphoesterase [Flavobacteriaceae bacterium S356]
MNPQQLEILESKSHRLGTLLEKASEAQLNAFSSLWNGFQEDETLLIKLMNSLPPTSGPYPSPTDPGNIEYGWALYFLNVTLPGTGSIGKWLYQKLHDNLGMPNTTISTTQWNDWKKTWSTSGVLMGDGSLVATQLYAVMDIGWSLAVIDFLELQIGLKTKAKFITTPNTVTVDSSSQPSLSIAVMGDWGSGNYPDGPSTDSPSTQVMSAIKNLAPDMVIHLGDVYYAGTDNGVIFNGEEQHNLIDVWQYKAPLGNFTLNSNHEMYDGANGYYNVAMASDIFHPYQTGASYFSIEYGDYIILGMDSAYDATGMYMQGRITNSDQIQFMNDASNKGKKIVLMTHHNPIDTLGDSLNDLWSDVNDTNGLNNPPYMWYWGHIHNGIVYNDNAASGNTLSRCLGNGAIPIGTGRWLKNGNIDYFTNTPLNDGAPNNKLRVKNGFAILTFDSNGITETWYDQSGDQCWYNQA